MGGGGIVVAVVLYREAGGFEQRAWFSQLGSLIATVALGSSA
jgi:hypothetical protein